MKTLVLAAGYATRLYPLTEHFPKSLLPIRGKTILDSLLEDSDTLPEIDGHIVVSNHRFVRQFEAWQAGEVLAVPGVPGIVEPTTVSVGRLKLTKPVTILDDGSVSNDTRLGAVKDILFAVKTLGLDDDLLVLAGDNVVDFSFGHFVRFAREKDASAIMCYEEPNRDMLRKGGVVMVGDDGRVVGMVEKPAEPTSSFAVPPFYVYRKEELAMLEAAIADGCGTDAPGSLVAWMCRQRPMYAWEMKVGGVPVHRFDVGDLEAYMLMQTKSDLVSHYTF